MDCTTAATAPAAPGIHERFNTTTYRAAYIVANADSTGGGIVLTTDDQLLAYARELATEVGAEGEIVIGEWTA